jgi:23S rRNA pseudouridine2605 synthase
MAVERLQKILSNAGVSSRRVAEELILAGRVAVNGTTTTELGARADTVADEVTVDGVPVLRERYRYFMLNKPVGFITTVRDEMNRETVLDLVPIADIQLHPVGRLDRDSEGLVLLTNDGHLTDLLTHPKYEVDKEYLVGLDSMPSQRDLQRLVRGVESDGERLRASSAQPAAPPEPGPGEEAPAAASWLVLVLREGRNREIRRMMEALGRTVLVLKRIRVGPQHIGNLGSGAFRELSEEEVEALYGAGKQAEAQSSPPATQAGGRLTIGALGPPPPRGKRQR